jgi:transposase-like protein
LHRWLTRPRPGRTDTSTGANSALCESAGNFYDFPAKHWIHLRTTNSVESTFGTVHLRTRVTKGPGTRAAEVAMAFKLIESLLFHNGGHHR